MTRQKVESAVARGAPFSLLMADGREYHVLHPDYISLPPKAAAGHTGVADWARRGLWAVPQSTFRDGGLRLAIVCFVALVTGSGTDSVKAGDERSRVIPVGVSITATHDYRVGQPLLVDVEVFNGLDTEIGWPRYSLTPNPWNGETASVHVMDIYRDGQFPSIFLKRPEIHPPQSIAGFGSERVSPKDRRRIQLDLSKWEVVGGWKPGRYQFTVAISDIDVDAFTTLRVASEPAELTVR